MSERIYKRQDGTCERLSEPAGVQEYCVEGPCPDESTLKGDYIKREDAIMTAMNYEGSGNAQDASQDIAAELASIPAADVRENMYSSWKIHRFNDGTTYAHCLNCKITQVFYGGKEPTYFCPNCGADMRGRRRKKRDGT